MIFWVVFSSCFFFVPFLGAELESWQLLIAPIVCIKRKIGLIKAVALGVGLQIKDNCLLWTEAIYSQINIWWTLPLKGLLTNFLWGSRAAEGSVDPPSPSLSLPCKIVEESLSGRSLYSYFAKAEARETVMENGEWVESGGVENAEQWGDVAAEAASRAQASKLARVYNIHCEFR